MPLHERKILDHLSLDPVLKPIISAKTISFPIEEADVFTYLVRSIVSQQLSVKAAERIYGRLLDLSGIIRDQPETFLSFSDDELRSSGLSYQKAKYVKNVCSFFLEKNLLHSWDHMSDEEISSLLTEIKGVGEWTAQMVLMFSLRRTDVFPIKDLGIQQGMQILYNLQQKDPKSLLPKILDISKDWSPYRSFASLAIWRFKNTAKNN